MANFNAQFELDALKDLFKNAWHFLKTTHVGNETFIKKPWYLVIGASNAGKTSLIQQTKLNFIPSKHLATAQQDESQDNKRCNWWLCDKAILLDIPGNYLATENSSITWQKFLNVANKYFRQKAPAGIILTLSLADWSKLNKTEQQTFSQKLRQNLLLLSKQLKNRCPVYLVFTHLDQIRGFIEFFSDLGVEERQQPWGLNFNNSQFTSELSLPGLFKTQFNQLLKRLHSRVIWRAQQERNIDRRALIQNFPWQLESQKESLANLIYQLGDILGLQNKLPLQGIYFVSNVQQGVAIDCIPKTPASELIPATPETIFTQNKVQATYFSQQLWQQIIFATTNTLLLPVKPPIRTKLRFSVYAGSALLILSSSLLMAYEFNSKVKTIRAAEASFANYRLQVNQLPPNTTNLTAILPSLNALQQTVAQLEQANLPWLIQDFHRQKTLLTLAEQNYRQILLHYYLPSLREMLETTLTTSSDPNLLYSTLKTYLMLGDSSHFDATLLRNWFIAYWQITFKNNPALQDKLLIHLDALLTQPFSVSALNQNLIAQTRTTLNATPDFQLAYIILKNQPENQKNMALQFDSKQQAANFNKIFISFNHAIIPAIFTAKQFSTVYFKQIAQACNAADHGDWVLGLNLHLDNSLTNKNELMTKVRELYLQDYAKYWQFFLSNLAISGWQDWQQAQDAITILADKKSPMTAICQNIVNNTTLDKLIGSNNLSPADLQLIQNNLTNQFHLMKDPSDIMQLAATQLKSYLGAILASHDDNKAAYLAAKLRFTSMALNDPIQQIANLASSLPEPFQDWLNSLASNTWRLILVHATDYLNQSWHDEVANYFTTNLQNRYPLLKTSTQDISLDSFSKFFGPQGIIDHYTDTYLNSFIDKSQAQWRYRVLNGQTINLAPALLSQLERAALIRTMFFSANQQLAVTFSLLPVALESDVKSISLNINGQTFEDKHHEHITPHFITWPTLSKPEAVTLTFVSYAGDTVNKTENGPWALFRLLDQTNLQALDNTKNFQLTFDLNGYAARYQLLAGNMINPFIPGIVNGFSCPSNLKN